MVSEPAPPEDSRFARLTFPNRTRRIPVRAISYSSAEFLKIQEGLPPNSMDDRWDLAFEGGRLVISRSWTGQVWYQALFEPRGDRKQLREILVSDFLGRHELEDVAWVWFLIGSLCLGSVKWVDVEGPRGRPMGWDERLVWLMRVRLGIEGAPLPTTSQERLEYFLDLLETHPGSTGLSLVAARLLEKAGRLVEAEAAYAAALGIDPLFIRVDRGLVRLRLGRVSGAAEDVEAALAEAAARAALPDSDPGLGHKLAMAFCLPLRQLIAADPEIRDLPADLAEKTAPWRPEAGRWLRGCLAIVAKDWKGAIAFLTEALRSDPGDSFGLRCRAYAFMKIGAVAEARGDVEALLSSDPMNGGALYLRARLRADENDLDGAIQDLARATLGEASPCAHLLMGRLLAKSGREPEAMRQHLRKSLKRDPGLPDLREEVRDVLRASGKRSGRGREALMKRYLKLVNPLPLPTAEQTRHFVDFVAGAHSWYKHLPAWPPGVPFYFFLDPNAGRSIQRTANGTLIAMDLKERGSHYSSFATEEYRRRFGHWQYHALAGHSFAFGSAAAGYDLVSSQTALLGTSGRWIPVPEDVLEAGVCPLTAFVDDWPAWLGPGKAQEAGDLERLRGLVRDHPEDPELRWYGVLLRFLDRPPSAHPASDDEPSHAFKRLAKLQALRGRALRERMFEAMTRVLELLGRFR